MKSKEKQLKSIKVAAHWAIWGWLLLIIPGLIASIVTLVKIASFRHHEENSGLKIVSIVFLVLLAFVGGITSLVFANNELELFHLEKNQQNIPFNQQPQQVQQQFESRPNSNNDYV